MTATERVPDNVNSGVGAEAGDRDAASAPTTVGAEAPAWDTASAPTTVGAPVVAGSGARVGAPAGAPIGASSATSATSATPAASTQSGIDGSTPEALGTGGSTPEALGTGGSTPGALGVDGSTPEALGTGGLAPGALGTGGSTPGALGTGGSTPGALGVGGSAAETPGIAETPSDPGGLPRERVPDLTLAERFVLNARAVRARAYVRFVATWRELSWLVFDIGFPIVAAAAYVFIYEALGAPAEYTGFVLLGGAMTAYWMNVLWGMASQFYWEKQSGLLEVYFLAPASRVALLLGMSAGGIFMSSVRAASTLVAGSLIFGIRYEVTSWSLTVLAFVLTLSALYCLGMLFASLFLMYGREAWHMANALQEPVYLASGFYFPVRALGFWTAMGASVIPLTLGLDAMRQLVFGMTVSGLLAVGWELFGLAALTVIYFAFAMRALGRMEHLAKQEGRLTLKWQ